MVIRLTRFLILQSKGAVLDIPFVSILNSLEKQIEMNGPLYRWARTVMEEDQRVKELEGLEVSDGLFYSPFSEKRLVIWLMWRGATVGSELAVEDLRRYLSTDSITVLIAIWIQGLTASHTVDLFDDIAFIPYDEVPETAFKQPFHGDHPYSTGFHEKEGVLVKRITVDKTKERKTEGQIGSASDSGVEGWPESLKKRFEAEESIRLAVEVLQLFTGGGVTITSSAVITPDYVPFGLFSNVSEGGGYDFPDQKLNPPGEISRIDISEAARTYKALVNSRGTKNERVIRTALGRISRAKKQLFIGDAILDLCIALEVLLLNDQGHGELTYRLATRGAWLLGTNAESRLEIQKELTRLYAYRSRLVHSGHIPDKMIGEAEESLARFESLTGQIARKIILAGWPDWDSLTLGA